MKIFVILAAPPQSIDVFATWNYPTGTKLTLCLLHQNAGEVPALFKSSCGKTPAVEMPHE